MDQDKILRQILHELRRIRFLIEAVAIPDKMEEDNDGNAEM